VGLRWRAAREQLAGDGADPATLDALENLVTVQAQSVPGLAAFAREGEIVFAAAMPGPPRQQISRYARLPHALPLLAQAPPRQPQLHVRADRAGGEIVAVAPRAGAGPGRSGEAAREEVSGPGWPVHKTSVGGWSQARYQRAAEEAWAENAKELAEAVTTAAARYHAELIVVAGDARARSLLLEHLGTPLRESAVIVDREVDASSSLIEEAADEAIRARADAQTRDRLERFRGQLATGQAAEGLAETLAALRDGQAAEVFVADDPSSDARAWVGPEPAQVAASREELAERGVETAVLDRADAALVAAAAATGAELWFVPEGEQPPRSGVGALLRYQVTS
jgi:hypothetical protein